jgi:hypothetical protein
VETPAWSGWEFFGKLSLKNLPLQTLNLRTKYERKDGRDLPWLDLMRPRGSGVCQVVSSTFAVANRRFEFEKHRQLFIRMHNVTLSVATMRVNNPDCSPFKIQS